MTERLIQKTSEKRPDHVASLPTTKDQAWEAAKNREAVAQVALTSAKEVETYLKGNKRKSITVDMGQAEDGSTRSGKVERVIGNSGVLRVKLLRDEKPEASFVYSGIPFPRNNRRPAITLLEEKPTAEGPDVHAIATDARAVVSLAMGNGINNHIYTGGDTVTDKGGVHFGEVTQVLAAAAQQAQVEQEQKVA